MTARMGGPGNGTRSKNHSVDHIHRQPMAHNQMAPITPPNVVDRSTRSNVISPGLVSFIFITFFLFMKYLVIGTITCTIVYHNYDVNPS